MKRDYEDLTPEERARFAREMSRALGDFAAATTPDFISPAPAMGEPVACRACGAPCSDRVVARLCRECARERYE